MVWGIVLVKAGIVALILVLPAQLKISLAAGHTVFLLILLVAMAVALVGYKQRGGTPQLSSPHRAVRAHVHPWSGGNNGGKDLEEQGTHRSVLEVPGACLYYEIHGSGSLMVMVPGANGVADGFRMVTEHLAAHYTVVLYDRRGFSRSHLDGPQDHDRRLTTDADDLRRLIEHVSDEPATVLGASSGGLVVLETLARHPSVVRTLVPFEPPAVKQLPDGQQWIDFFSGIYDLYRRSGIEPALEEFREHAFPELDRQIMARTPKNSANATYWFEHELRQYPAVELDLDALVAHADRIVPVIGRESRGHPACEVTVELGKKLGRDVIELPGGHVGYLSHPAEFAHEFVHALGRTGHGPKG